MCRCDGEFPGPSELVRLRNQGAVPDALRRISEARVGRLAARVARCAGIDDDAGRVLASVGVVARSSVVLEHHLAGSGDRRVSAVAYLERFATLRATTAGRPMLFRTSVADLTVDRSVARCVALAVCELIEAVELATPDAPDLMLVVEDQDDDLVVAFAAADGEVLSVPTGAAAACLLRAERLVADVGGGLERGVRDGMWLVGFILPIVRLATFPDGTERIRHPAADLPHGGPVRRGPSW